MIVPKIEFANDISKLPDNEGGASWRYRIKFKNTGSRALVDVQVIARLSIKGLTHPKNWTNITLPVNWSGESKVEVPRLSKKNNRIIRLFISHSHVLRKSPTFPPEIRNKANNEQLLLEDIYLLGADTKLVIWVFGYDEFSGSRKLFRSPDYFLANIKEGHFNDLDVVPEHQQLFSSHPSQH